MDFKNITVFPEMIEDVVIYLLVAVFLCLVSKTVYDWKEKRRLEKEVAEYRQMKEEEREESCRKY